MWLPRNNYELNQIFINASAPEIFELKGEYFVDMLTGLPSLRRFSHRKIFYSENNNVFGYNILFTKRIWGRCFLEVGICKELDSSKVVVINYDRVGNSFISNKIRDYIRCVQENILYLGRFNYFFKEKLCFLGYFSLRKKG